MVRARLTVLVPTLLAAVLAMAVTPGARAGLEGAVRARSAKARP
jgi:hypothetical protein